MNNETRNLLIFGIFLIVLIILFSLTSISYFFLDSGHNSGIIKIFVDYHILFMFIVTILALIFGFMSYILLTKTNLSARKKQKDFLNDVLSLLDKNERKILEYLMKNNYCATQYELVKVSKTHKVKVHRIIEKFEERGIIEKQRIGKINKIFLKENYKF